MTGREIHARFSALPGAEHIATEEAIDGLLRLLGTYRPRTVLEIGAGIGTLTWTLLDGFQALGLHEVRITTIENDDFCLRELRRNLADRLAAVRLVHDLDDVANERFELVIVDGGNPADPRFLDAIAKRGVVFVEGYRHPQRDMIAASPRRFVAANIRSTRQTAQGRWGGAYWIYRFEPSWTERLRFSARHLWDGLLVTKRRAIRQAAS